MSGHADTIRYEQLAAICSVRAFSAAEAEEAVNLLLDVPALLAENRRLRDALEYALAQVPMYSDHAHVLRAALAGDTE